MRLAWVIIAAFLYTSPASADAPVGSVASTVSAEAKLAAAAVRLPRGFTIGPVASEPNLANPVAFCFDPRGRIFVAETHRVHQGVEDNRHHMDWLDDDLAARSVDDRRQYMIRRMGDEISRFTKHSDLVRLLEDRDADGLYERSSVFSTGYNEVEFGAAAGVLWAGDRLLFTCIPSLWELRDADGDGQAEQKKALASGFGVHVALYGHDLHGLTHGPDGKIYFSIGDRGLHVKASDGRVHSNPDSGAVLRCNPDGSQLEVFATGLRNPQELAFNECGDLFTVDNNSDSGDRARLVHIVEGMDAGWRMSYQYLPDRGPFNREKIWHTQNDDQPASIVPPLAHITEGPSGLVQYPGTGLPPKHAGAFFVCDFHGAAGNSGVREFWIEPAGATYRLAREEMFAEGVLATDCDFGPDGALYIADWIDGWGGTGKGRIHRVASEDEPSTRQRSGTQALLKRIEELAAGELLNAIGHADMRVRLAAQRQLVARGSSVANELVQTARSSTTPLVGRLHAVWAVGQLSEQSPELLTKLVNLASADESEVRVQIARMLGRGAGAADKVLRENCSEQLAAMLADPSLRVQASAAMALGRYRRPDALAPLLELARDHAGADATLRHAVAVGLAGTQTPEALVAAATSAGKSERLAIVVALGRQRSNRVGALLNDPSPRIRTEAARIIWDVPLPGAFKPLAAALDNAPSDDEPMLRRAIAANVALRTPSHLASIVRCGLRPDLSPIMRDHVWQLVHDWANPSPRDPVHGLWRPLEPRTSQEVSSTLSAALPQMIEAGANGTHGLVVAAELGLAAAYEPIAGIVANEQYAPELRGRAVAALQGAPDSIAIAAMNAAMKSGEPSVRSRALQLMLQRFPDRAVGTIIEVAESGAVPEQQAAILMLPKLDDSAAKAAVRRWLERLEQGECPAELQLEVIEAAHQTADSELVRRAQAYQDQQRASEDPLAQYAASLHGGNAESGRRIFEENVSLACRRCHSTQPDEKLVGPSLADVGQRLSRRELLASIVKPNDKIAEGFQTTVLQLDTGKVVSGILRSEDESRAVLVDPEGKEIAVSVAKIEDRFEGLSAMPEDLVKQMTSRELRDLVEWLTQQRTAAGDGSRPLPPANGQPDHGAASR